MLVERALRHIKELPFVVAKPRGMRFPGDVHTVLFKQALNNP